MNTTATSSTRQLCRASRPFVPRSVRLLNVRASREAELARLSEFKKGLSARLEQANQPRAASEGAAVATETVAPAGKTLREVTKDDFYEVIKSHGDRLTVVDCYTDWCGPCKMIMPTLVQWAEELEGSVEIVKFNCNKHNKELGVALGIKVAPTFLLYKSGQQVASMTGAKTEQLRELIEQHM